MVCMDDMKGTFGCLNFADAELGDRRRTNRLVDVTNKMTRHPGGSLPDKMKCPATLRALYRLMNCDEVTHEAVIKPHRESTFRRIAEHSGTLLVIHDGTELDYTGHESLSDLGQIGNGSRRGYICQNSLVVDPGGGEVIGLASQILYRREKVSKNEGRAEKRNRETRESRIWLRGTEGLPEDWSLVDICDQGADTCEFLENEFKSGRRFLIRSKHDRMIHVGHEQSTESRKLRGFARQLKPIGKKTVKLSAGSGRKARKAELCVSFAPVQVIPPKRKRGQHGNQPMPLWVVRVWEPDPPAGEEALEWFLLTNHPVKNVKDAIQVVGWYERRWIVEEYHKAMKTGCDIEDPQFTSEESLQPTIALLSVVALTLLNLRDTSRLADAKTRSATDVISVEYVEVLSGWRYKQVRSDLTIHEFFYALARLGGHQNRRHDKQPGWLILWRGWTMLQAMLLGARAVQRKKCG